MDSTRPRPGRATAYLHRWDGSRLVCVPISACSRCTATATPACSATVRFSGRAMCSRRGKRSSTRTCRSAINTALSGIPFWGTDIGGFVPTKELTGELYVRWFQFAAFCPLFRSHGRTWKLRLPWGWNTGSLEPGRDPEHHGRRGQSRSERAPQRRRRTDLPHVPRAALPSAAVSVQCGAGSPRHRDADRARALAALPGRPRGGRARRSVLVGTRHAGGAGGREGRVVPRSLPSGGPLGATSGTRPCTRAASIRAAGRSIWRRSRSNRACRRGAAAGSGETMQR